jgi:hypothetical protein
MAWLSRNNFTSSDFLQASDLNNLANDIRAWGGNVNGGGYTLANVVIESGSVTAGMPDPTTTLGDLIVRGQNPPPTRLGVGTDGEVLIADSTQTLGMRWGNPAALAPVTTVFGRTGTVSAQAGDYTVSQITGAMVDPTTQKGDLVVHGTLVLNRLPVGADGQVLMADSTQNLGVKWAATAGAVASVFGRSGAVVAQAGDYTVAQITGAAASSVQIVAGSGLSGGGPLTANVTLAANVVSVFGRTGAVVLTAPDIAGVAVPVSRQVLAGTGMTGGGALSADVTLNANVISVFGRTGSVTLTAADVTGVGGVLNTTQVIAGTGLTGGGALSGNVTLTVNPKTINQLVEVQQSGANVGLRPTINFISTGAVNLTVADNSTNNSVDVTFGLASTAVNVLVNGTNIGTRPTLNLIASSNVTISGSDNSTNNRVDITVAASGGTGGGGSQTPWLQDVDAGSFALFDVNYVSVNRTKDTSARVSINTGTEDGVKITSASAAGQAQMHLVNSDGSAHLFLDAWGSSATTGPPSTPGINTTGPLAFLTNNTRAMTISTAQRVLIGTTTDDGVNLLQVNGKIKSLTGGIVFPDSTIQTTAAVTGMTDPTTTKGDLIAHGTTTTRLPVGADGLVLTADSTQSLGVSWKAAAGGVASVFGRTGAVVATAGDYTVGQVTGAVPNTVQVIAGVGLTGGGALSGNVTLTGAAFKASGSAHAPGDVPDPGATVGTTRYLREDATWVAPTPASIGAVPTTVQVIAGTGLTGGGPLTGNVTLNVANPAQWVSGSGGAIYYNGGVVLIGTTTIAASGANDYPLQVMALPGGDGIRATGTGGYVGIDAYAYYSPATGGQNSGGEFDGFSARGTLAAPTATQANDYLSWWGGNGYTGSGFHNGGGIAVFAASTWTTANAETYITFNTTPNASLTQAERVRITSAGNVGIGITTPNAKLSFGSNIYTPPFGSSYGQYQIILYDGGTASGSYGMGIESFNIGFNSAGGYKFYQGGAATPIMVVGGQSSTFVGIGTASPTAPLDILGVSASGGLVAHFKATGNNFGYITLDTSNATKGVGIYGYCNGVWNGELDFNYDGSVTFWSKSASVAPITITPAGSVGIGVTNPGYGFQTSGFTAAITNDAGGAVSNPGALQLRVTGKSNVNQILFLGFDTTNNVGVIQPGVAGSTWNNLCLNPVGGTVGIGTTNPNDSLTINGMAGGGTGQIRMIYGNYGVFFRNDGANFYVMVTASGSAASGSWTTPYPIQIDLPTHCVGMRVAPNTSWGVHVDSLLCDGPVNAGYFQVPAGTGSTGIFRVQDSAGSSYYNCSFSGGIMYAYTSVSDARLKKNIRPFARGLKEIRGLRPSAFEYIDGPEGTFYNVVAQETEDVLPEAVKEVDTSKGRMLNIVDQPIVMALINAVQELGRRVQALEEKLAY